MTEVSNHTHGDKPRVMLWVSSTTSSGHMVIADRVTQALRARGCEVVLLSDDESLARLRPEGATIVQIPRFNQPNFREAIMEAYRTYQPDIFVTENIPLSIPSISNKMGFVLDEMHKAAQEEGRALNVFGYVRDYPDPLCDNEKLRAEGLLEHYDSVLVQGDDALMKHPNDRFFGHSLHRKLLNKMLYTGYPVPEMERLPSNNEVVISAGGGFDEAREFFFNNLIEAKPFVQSELKDKTWRMFVSNDLSGEKFDAMKAKAAEVGGIEIERVNGSYLDKLRGADMAVSQAGISSVEIAALGMPAVIVPHYVGSDRFRFANTQEYERAGALAKHCPQISKVEFNLDRSPREFASILDKTYAQRRVPPKTDVRINGHEAFADYLVQRHQGVEPELQPGRSKAR
ncbi:MAG: hypothetical protein CMM94_03940 [Rickettsiales bacterium]|nr:hypothetical protein [Rickettsiales bacterium]